MPYGGVYRRDPWTTWTRPPFPPYTFVAPATPAGVPEQFGKPRLRIKSLPRSGGRFDFAFSLVEPPPREIQKRRLARRLNNTQRRGTFFEVPPDQVVVAAPSTVLIFRDQNQRIAGRPTRRGQFFSAPFNGLSLEQAVVPEFNGRPANRSPLPTRRGRFFFPVRMVGFAPGQLDTPPFIRQRRRPQLPVRRGFVFAYPFPAAVVTTQALPPSLIRQSRRPQLPTRRWRSWTSPFLADRSLVPDRITSRRARTYIPRRGSFFDFLLVGLAPGQFVVPDRIDSQRARIYTARRGQFIQFAPPQVVVTPPGSQALPPQWIIPANRRRTFTLARRGQFRRFFPIVGSGLGYLQAAVPPFVTARRRPVPALARRGHFQPVPLVSPDVVTFRRSRRALGTRVLQRQRFQPVPLAASPVPQRRSDSSTRRTARGALVRRGRYQQFPLTTAAVVDVDDGFFNFFG